jgi:hypothetical protein
VSQGTEMHERAAPEADGLPEAMACFVVVIQGSTPWAGLVDGIEGVKEALLRILWKDPGGAVLEDVASILASLDAPTAWAAHGSGDGRPYWHWWCAFEGGSVTVQRLTESLPSKIAVGRLRSTLDEVTGVLADCADDLRKLTAGGRREYVFTRRSPGQDPV